MKKFKLTLEYDGGAFCGWQRQDNTLSVQQAVEGALKAFTQLPDVTLYVAGRTDAGVHAKGQVAHVELPSEWSPYRIQQAVNAHLQSYKVSVLLVEEAPEDFHARFSAIRRQYMYKIINREAKLSIDQGYAWQVKTPLNTTKMQEAANLLLGKNDFSSFRTVHCQAKNPIRTLERFDIQHHEDVIECWVEAPSFLHHQVRNMVGTLVQVGRGKWQPSYVQEILNKKDRSFGGPTAPADGLYLIKVFY
jgi:tRNA pseudouridine38-40 synthase